MFDNVLGYVGQGAAVTARIYRNHGHGTDYRLEATNRADFAWPQGFTIHSNSERREVEVQGFVDDMYGTGPIVAVVMMGPEGEANTMVSPAEARYLAVRLISAADEAENLWRTSKWTKSE